MANNNLRDVLMPILGGLIAAASPQAGRAVVAGGRMAERSSARRKKEEAHAQQAHRGQTLRDSLSSLLIQDGPEADALRARLDFDPGSAAGSVQQFLRGHAEPPPSPGGLSLEEWANVRQGADEDESLSANVLTPGGVPVRRGGRGLRSDAPPPGIAALSPEDEAAAQQQEARAEKQAALFGHISQGLTGQDRVLFGAMAEVDPKRALTFGLGRLEGQKTPKPTKQDNTLKKIRALETRLGQIRTQIKHVQAQAMKAVGGGDRYNPPNPWAVAPNLTKEQAVLTKQLFGLRATRQKELESVPASKSTSGSPRGSSPLEIRGASGAGASLAQKHLGG